jgi:hypothetical protein
MNCSKCGKVCPAGPNGPGSCSLGICSAAGCPGGKGDCDHVAANGCEVDLTSDVNNCGACGAVCPTVANGVRNCSGSVCGVASCTANFGNCDGNGANGCESNTLTDPNNCGGCGRVCPATTPVCQAGTCTGCLAGGLSPPRGCFLGADLGSGALYNVCSADCNTAWISADGNGGSYHALQICQTLGYNSLGSYGGTCGSVCGYCSGGSCVTPGTQTFDGAGLCGQDAGGPILCITVMWTCIR